MHGVRFRAEGVAQSSHALSGHANLQAFPRVHQYRSSSDLIIQEL